MVIIEQIYRFKKDIAYNIRKFYSNYFTVDGMYTSLLPDKLYLKKLYKKKTGKKLNLKNPTLFNEKLNWLKLYNRRPEYTMMADKYCVRKYIKEKIGEEYLVPLLGVYDRVEDIDFDSLPNQFVLKCNHDSEVVICRDKANNVFQCKKGKIDSLDEVKVYLKKRLKINFYKASREWPYKNIERKIVCEKYICEEDGDKLTDYKFHCFNGTPKFVYVVSDKNGNKHLDYFNMGYDHLTIEHPFPHKTPDKMSWFSPNGFEKMQEIAFKLSFDIPYCRVDLYNIAGKIYFGEITFFHIGGFSSLYPEKWDRIFGDYIELPKKKYRAR